MIYLQLFWSFVKIGLFTIGGGYAMIPMIHDEVVGNGWVSSSYFWDFFAVSEATPGPVALKMTTFIGFNAAPLGVLGAAVATLGMILPAYLIIFLIAKLFTSFSENKHVKNVFWGLKPVVVALVCSAAVMLLMKVVFPQVNIKGGNFDFATNQNPWGILIFAVAFVFGQVKIKKKGPHPIALIGLSAGIGILLYGVIL